MTDKRLLEMAVEAMENSYTPYSHRKIGAAIESKDGSVFSGCVIENVAIGTTICAEAAAISAAVSAGHRTFKRIAIISEGNTYRLPCGTCRQILNEFSPEIEVLCARASDGRYVSYPLTSLLPLPLDANDE
ncbi:MAG: cytidine deaminase [Oscillospiraceae bacterium]|nr:cytidine deaminase [Oscillospiraceae bacterium]MCL2277861.1 cytidine deaminase [Oscillospiraceae bacterium]